MVVINPLAALKPSRIRKPARKGSIWGIINANNGNFESLPAILCGRL
jgi:hypothetical protein